MKKNGNGNDWSKWSNFVLGELKRINNTLIAMDKKMHCGVHKERMKQISSRINYLYLGFASVILIGIVLGVWMKTIIQ